jgi:hypothetical protein
MIPELESRDSRARPDGVDVQISHGALAQRDLDSESLLHRSPARQ